MGLHAARVRAAAKVAQLFARPANPLFGHLKNTAPLRRGFFLNRWMMLLVVGLALDATWALYAAPRDGIIACLTTAIGG
jgi:hypothetical protein